MTPEFEQVSPSPMPYLDSHPKIFTPLSLEIGVNCCLELHMSSTHFLVTLLDNSLCQRESIEDKVQVVEWHHQNWLYPIPDCKAYLLTDLSLNQ
jgi:hypothetical protein